MHLFIFFFYLQFINNLRFYQKTETDQWNRDTLYIFVVAVSNLRHDKYFIQWRCTVHFSSDSTGSATIELTSSPIRYEPPRHKTNKMTVRPAKTQISLGIRPVCSESSLSAWRKLGSLATHGVHSECSDQTGRMPRLIWVFAGRTFILLVLTWGGSYLKQKVS